MRNGIGHRIALSIVPVLGAWFVRAWFATCRIRVHNEQRFREAERNGPIIGTCWHYCVLGIFIFFRNYPSIVMVSASEDGDLVARMAEKLGFSVVRGSSNRKGVGAAKELIRELRRGKNGGLVADGSQGPPRIAQSGPILLAAKSGGAVVPILYSASRYIAFNTWDRLLLPKPFSTIDLFYGEPLTVPAEVKACDLEDYRSLLEETLNELYAEAWGIHGKTEH